MLKLLDSGRLPIQAPILNRLSNVLFMNIRTAIKIGNGAGHLENAGVGAGRKAETISD